MKNQGEIEANVCKEVYRIEQQFMGGSPGDIEAYLIGDLLLVRLRNVLSAPESRLVDQPSIEKGIELLKQLRVQFFEATRPTLEAMAQDVTGVKLLSLHHDISTRTGEELIIFTLESEPVHCDKKFKTSNYT